MTKLTRQQKYWLATRQFAKLTPSDLRNAGFTASAESAAWSAQLGALLTFIDQEASS